METSKAEIISAEMEATEGHKRSSLLLSGDEAALDLGKDDVDTVSNARTKAHNHDCD